jgi:molybdopterin-containing oxidoreductase family iron-sulfur binding subunit
MKENVNRREFLKKALTGLGVLAVTSPIAFFTGRKMTSAADETQSTPRKTRPWVMVIDLKKCDGCVPRGTPPQCTQTCVQGHFAPKGQQWIEVYQVELPGKGSYFLPTPCFQCENAPCVNVCPVSATYHDEDGVVLIDHRRCIGCRLCMAACPYQRRFFNWGEPQLPPEAALAEYSPLYPVPAVKGTVIKCMFCAHMLANGRLPFCVLGCPTRALYMGDLNEDIGSNGQEVVKLSKFLADNDAFRWKEELGTKPRVWYLPGHGQEVGRKADDPRKLIPVTWQWGGFKKPGSDGDK